MCKTNPHVLAGYLHRQREELLSALASVDAALQRIDQGTYGLCERCGQTIDADRLAQLPWTGWCSACKRAYEQRRGIVSCSEPLPQAPRHGVGDS